MSYDNYRKKVLEILSLTARQNEDFGPGSLQGVTKDRYRHILPLKDGINNRESRVKAIKDYLKISIENRFLPKRTKVQKESLHPYIHHLNSSQLLCYMVFRSLIDADGHPKKELIDLLKSLEINISTNSECRFEYSDGMFWKEQNEAEGTSFDFYIRDDDNEFFFEIKFTENGFGKAQDDTRHLAKIKDLYLPQINQSVDTRIVRDNYQLFRNTIRANAPEKTVIFITDKNNPATQRDIANFKKSYLTGCKGVVRFLTWQDIATYWPTNIATPFQFECFK